MSWSTPIVSLCLNALLFSHFGCARPLRTVADDDESGVLHSKLAAKVGNVVRQDTTSVLSDVWFSVTDVTTDTVTATSAWSTSSQSPSVFNTTSQTSDSSYSSYAYPSYSSPANSTASSSVYSTYSPFAYSTPSSSTSSSNSTYVPSTSTSTSTIYYTPSPTYYTPSTSTSTSTIYYTPSSSSTAAATSYYTSSTASASASASATSTAPSSSSTFNPMARNNVAVYYGQTNQTSSVNLTTICADPNVDIVILAFLATLFGPGGYPVLNQGANCATATANQTVGGASGLLDCVTDGFAAQAAQCQTNGKKVLLSIGGAAGYSDTTISSAAAAQGLAQTIWDLFLGGTNDTALRPFGDVVLDGIDIDNESGTYGYIDTLISSLRTLYQTDTTGHKYFLSAAPQCPQPDASIPLSSMQTAVDFIWVQFYNNPFCNLNSPGFLASLASWSASLSSNGTSGGFVDVGNGVSSPRLYVGGADFAAAGSGYVDTAGYATIVQGVQAAGIANLGGVMLWDGAYGEESGANGGETYMQIAKSALA